jgi:hypothetical protein
MANDIITVHGEDVVVREDTAKAFRFVRWGMITAGLCLSTMIILFIVLFLKMVSG